MTEIQMPPEFLYVYCVVERVVDEVRQDRHQRTRRSSLWSALQAAPPEAPRRVMDAGVNQTSGCAALGRP